jgi:hypothetical protein
MQGGSPPQTLQNSPPVERGGYAPPNWNPATSPAPSGNAQPYTPNPPPVERGGYAPPNWNPAPTPAPTQSGGFTVSYSINPDAQPADIAAHGSGANGFLQSTWSIPSLPGSLDNVHFPMQINDSAQHGTGSTGEGGGQYFAQHIGFTTPDGKQHPDGRRGYIGIQPSTEDGKAYAIFSGWGKGVTTTTGHSGADGDSGASNKTKFDFQYGHKYDLSVEVDKNDPKTLNGYVQDVTDPNNPQPKVLIGNLKFEHPVSIGNHDSGFVEQFGSNTTSSTQVHRATGEFGAPYTEGKNGKTQGTISPWSPYGNYKNSITGTTTQTTDPKTGAQRSSFDVSGAGWQPGTSIPGINTDQDPVPPPPSYEPDKNYPPGSSVTYQGGEYTKSNDGTTRASPDGTSIPGFVWTGQAPAESNGNSKTSDSSTPSATQAQQNNQSPPAPYDGNKTYQPGDVVNYYDHLFEKTPDGSEQRSPDGYSLPGFTYIGMAP